MKNVKHFLTGEELTPAEVTDLLMLAETLRQERNQGKFVKPLQDKSVALLFDKPSLRTRFSFSIGLQELGAHVVESTSADRKKEEPEDLIRVLAGYTHAVMLRTHAHAQLERMTKRSKVPVINGLSDTHHPCQALADILTLKQEYGTLKGLTLAYVGDGNNVLHSLLLLAPALGINVRFSCPQGYEPNGLILKRAKARAAESQATVQAYKTPSEAVKGANAVYTDVWTSMGFEGEEIDREKVFKDYQVNEKLMALAAPKAIFLHCLPMVRGKEVSEKLPDSACSRIFLQSENRLHVQKALLLKLLT